MQRVTITLDDDLLETLDSLSQRRGYNNRSEAIRDILRSALAQEATQQHGTQGFAVLSYVYEHEKRDLASRIVSTQHHHHDLSVATLHVHINHDDCLEIAVLKGDMGDVQHFADDVIAQRGVRHGHLQCLPYAIVPIVFLNRSSAMVKNAPPIAISVRNCGQTISNPAPR